MSDSEDELPEEYDDQAFENAGEELEEVEEDEEDGDEYEVEEITNTTHTYEVETPQTIKIVKPEDRRTLQMITPLERVRLIGIRAEQINNGDKVFLSDKDMQGLTDPVDIAEKELFMRRCPILIERKLDSTGNIVEHLNPNEMLFPITI